MAQEKIVISSPWGKVTAELVDNAATRALLEMLPVTLEMTRSSSPGEDGKSARLVAAGRTPARFRNGTLGLWGSTDFVIYYRKGSVPRPGIIILGRVDGDASIFDRPGPVTVQIDRAK